MHGNSYNLMKDFVERYDVKSSRVADMGSMNINGSYKDLFTGEYVGIDLEWGKNVRLIIGSEAWDNIGLFDTVICGQVLEHCEHVPELMDNIVRILKPGGYCCLIVPSAGPAHGSVWVKNYSQDEVKKIFEDAGLEVLEIKTTIRRPFNDVRCIAQKGDYENQ